MLFHRHEWVRAESEVLTVVKFYLLGYNTV
jgi:hypothetical protein